MDQCKALCQGSVGFTYFAVFGECECCSDLHQSTGENGWGLYANLAWDSPPAPSGYKLKCGPFCRCTSFGPIQSDLDINTCGGNCGTWAGFIFSPYPPQGGTDCRCCNNLVEARGVTTQWNLYEPSGGGITGDPHVTTLDGKHYLLLKQGTFNLWHFSGLETDFPEAKKLPVDWQVYAHYSGHQGFTKALLLLDNTEGSALELTAQDCKWKARSGEGWKALETAELVSVPGSDSATGFDVSSTGGKGGHEFANRVHFNMNTKHGKAVIAVMSLSCRPKHNINVQISMTRRTDDQFVDGELKRARSFSMLQTSTGTSTDSEFSMDRTWQELGGSPQATGYLQRVDGEPSIALLTQICSAAEESQAKEICSKHLRHDGTSGGVGALFHDCVFDLCHGAGETQAELAAELLDAMTS